MRSRTPWVAGVAGACLRSLRAFLSSASRQDCVSRRALLPWRTRLAVFRPVCAVCRLALRYAALRGQRAKGTASYLRHSAHTSNHSRQSFVFPPSARPSRHPVRGSRFTCAVDMKHVCTSPHSAAAFDEPARPPCQRRRPAVACGAAQGIGRHASVRSPCQPFSYPRVLTIRPCLFPSLDVGL